MADFHEYRSRSRSPNRRRMSDGDDHMRGGYGEYRGSGRRFDDFRPSSRSGYGGRRGAGGFRGGFDSYRGGFPPRGGRSFRGDRPRRSRGRGGPLVGRIMDPHLEDKLSRNYENSIFIGNLSFDSTPEDLHDFFSSAGEVVRADVITSRGRHRGMGTVEFATHDAVENAIQDLNGVEFMGRALFVRQENPPPEMMEPPMRMPPAHRAPRERFSEYPPPARAPLFEVFIINLPYAMTWQSLKDLFREAGDVIRADIELDRNGYSRGFGSVYYETEDEMFNAIERFNGFEVDGRVLQVREGKNSPGFQEHFSGPPPMEPEMLGEIQGSSSFTDNVVGGGERNPVVYCSNLPLSTATGDLYDLFETIGRVRHAELKYDETGAPTGIAVIEYENEEDADFCIQRLNNYNYGGCALDISFAKFI
ncbi:Serine/arginine (SR)-type shuttling mRNA binding protein GBP2 [Nakaseomyces bracarensis]|uniref:Serine/arginine (SR)-type shuttling mRNA binding protein GBP2 n=1 Tax=Nakaseomyces bracarensis TaxID=273131 RepID=A0ABR4P0X9_9SACH